MKSLSLVQLLEIPWTAAYQTPPSTGFSRQEYWSGLPLPSPVSCSVVSNSLPSHGPQPSWLLCPWDSPGKNTGECCHSLLQGIFPTQGSNPCPPRCRQILYHLNRQGSPEHRINTHNQTKLKARMNTAASGHKERQMVIDTLQLHQ